MVIWEPLCSIFFLHHKKCNGKPYCVFTFYPLKENPGAGSGQFKISVSLEAIRRQSPSGLCTSYLRGVCFPSQASAHWIPRLKGAGWGYIRPEGRGLKQQRTHNEIPFSCTDFDDSGMRRNWRIRFKSCRGRREQ